MNVFQHFSLRASKQNISPDILDIPCSLISMDWFGENYALQGKLNIGEMGKECSRYSWTVRQIYGWLVHWRFFLGVNFANLMGESCSSVISSPSVSEPTAKRSRIITACSTIGLRLELEKLDLRRCTVVFNKNCCKDVFCLDILWFCF